MAINVLVLGENTFPFHRFETMAGLFEAALSASDIAPATTTDRDVLTDLDEVDVLVDYLTDNTFSTEQLDGLLDFVRDGGGYVGVHCAADLTTTADGNREEPLPALRDLLGGHFVTHPERTNISVSIVNTFHPITAGIDGFRLWDEPYQLEVDTAVTVLARMDHPELADMPVAWTKSYGDGKVFYLSLGHSRSAYHVGEVQTLLKNGVRWAHDP